MNQQDIKKRFFQIKIKTGKENCYDTINDFDVEDTVAIIDANQIIDKTNIEKIQKEKQK